MAEITKEYLDEKYAVFARNRENYNKVIGEIYTLFDLAVERKDISVIMDYEEKYSAIDGIRTAETFKLDIIKNILLLEKEHDAEHFFFEDCCDCKELLDHYKRCTLYIRRLEMPLKAELKREAFMYLIERKVSGIAILSILSYELFEHKDFLSKILYENLCKGMDLMHRLKNLDYYSEYLDDTYYRLNKAFLFLEYGDRQLARECLLKIVNPSRDVLALLKNLED